MVRGLIHVKHDESVSLKKKRTKDETVVKIYRRVIPCFWKLVSPRSNSQSSVSPLIQTAHLHTVPVTNLQMENVKNVTCTFCFTVVTPQMSRLYKELEEGPLYHHLCSCLHASHHHIHKGLKEISNWAPELTQTPTNCCKPAL